MSTSASLMFYYITCQDIQQAKDLGRKLLENKLAACVNIFPHMHSMYHWQGQIESSEEVVLLAKSVAEKRAAIEDYVNKHHPYTTPCIIGIPTASVNAAYQQWLQSNLL